MKQRIVIFLSFLVVIGAAFGGVPAFACAGGQSGAKCSGTATMQQSPFSDITGHWALPEINEAVRIGWVNGYPDRSFKPDGTITRHAAANGIGDDKGSRS